MMRQMLGVLMKDLRLDLASPGRLAAVVLFSVITLLLFSFAVGPDTTTLSRNTAGYLWLALVLSSTLALGESFRLEVEDDALEGLLLLPVAPAAIFYGKALANLFFLLALATLLVPLAFALYGASVRGNPAELAAIIALGAAGLAGPGTLYSAMTARARGSDVMLPLLLFPLVIPVLIAAVKATSLVLLGDPMGDRGAWFVLVGSFDLVYWSLCGLLFGKVVDA
jgi:heme exporter protein B